MRISDWSSDVCSSDLDEEEFHHALPRLLDHWTVRADFLSISRRECAAGLRFGWPRLHFNETHAAIARDGQPLMIEEARNFLARKLTCLTQGSACGDFQFYTIDGSLGLIYSAASIIGAAHFVSRLSLSCSLEQRC